VARPTRAAGIDLGKARVGLAVADELGLYAHPRPYLDGRNRKALLAELTRVAREDRIERFVVGLPLELSGAQGPSARRAIEFAQQLANATGVEVELVDERLTTVEADQQLQASGVSRRDARGLVDGVAAAVLLQCWLDGGEDPSQSDIAE